MKSERAHLRAAARSATSIRTRRPAIVLAAIVFAVLSGCGGGDGRSQEEFRDHLQSIDQQGGELWGRLAESAADLKPGQSLPADVRQPMLEMVEFQRSTAEELDGLEAPQGASEEIQDLVDALRERTRVFEHAAAAGRLTEQDFEQLTQVGEKIDAVFQQLRAEGFLPSVEEHDE